jgi:RNA polymerase sigma-70 factor, ECF subfamily
MLVIETGGDRDADLLRRVATPEAGAALEQLYDRFAAPVYRIGLGLLRDRQLAEDVVQDTFVRIWRSAARFDPARASASTWIFTIARRAAIDVGRRRPPDGGEPPEGLGRDDDAMEAVVTGVVVRDALETLSAPHREVLELAYEAGLTQTTIAERLGLPLGTVKSRTYHGLQALREALAERGVDA